MTLFVVRQRLCLQLKHLCRVCSIILSRVRENTLPHVESVIYEDGLGLVGWVAGQRILLGKPQAS